MNGGAYVGDLVARWMEDGRRMQLTAPFGYIDPQNVSWPVPEYTIVDGASIPRALWSLVGSPYTGKYRDASVIHDYFCDARDRPWSRVHRVFYDGMITSLVPELQARMMYLAVYCFGPRWSGTVVHNVRLRRDDVEREIEEAADRRTLAGLTEPARDQFTEAVAEATEVNNIPLSRWQSRRSRPSSIGRMAHRATNELSSYPGGKAEVKVTLDFPRLQKAVSKFEPAPSDIAHALDEVDRRIGSHSASYEPKGVERLSRQYPWHPG